MNKVSPQNFRIEPIDATFGAVVTNLDAETIDEVTWRSLYAAWLKYSLLVFPALNLTREQQQAFATRFGPLEVDMIAISNVRPDGTLRTEENDANFLNILRGNYDWHTDSSFKSIHAKGAVFAAEVVPPQGGETGFADMTAAYAALDPAMRAKVDNATAIHSFHNAQARMGHKVQPDDYYKVEEDAQARRPMVKVHPETGRKSLLIGRHAHGVSGMSDAESEKFLAELHAFACQPPRIYHHPWQPGDVVVWDNRCLLHRVKPWDMREPRIMWHTRMAGDPVSEAALAS